jgi:membrane-bound transcription factor site-1 protease
MEILQAYRPRASAVPAVIDLNDCPYMWPYCLQPLYARAQPIIFNATVLNGMGVWGYFKEPPRWIPTDNGGKLLQVAFTYSEELWPWSGHVSLHIRVKDSAAEFRGEAHGLVRFEIVSPPHRGAKVGWPW